MLEKQDCSVDHTEKIGPRETGRQLSLYVRQCLSNMSYLEDPEFAELIPEEKITVITALLINKFWNSEFAGDTLVEAIKSSDRNKNRPQIVYFFRVKIRSWLKNLELDSEVKSLLIPKYELFFNEGSILSDSDNPEKYIDIPENLGRGLNTLLSHLVDLRKNFRIEFLHNPTILCQLLKKSGTHLDAMVGPLNHDHWERDLSGDLLITPPLTDLEFQKRRNTYKSDPNSVYEKPKVGCPWKISGVTSEVYKTIYGLIADGYS